MARPVASSAHPAPRRSRPSLLNLCVGFLGRHLEDVIDGAHLFGPALPAAVKASLLAIARKRGLLCDQLLIALADEAWEILDLSGSQISDAGIGRIAAVCTRLRAVDLSECDCISSQAVQELVQHCPSLETLRLGGSTCSDEVARNSLDYILPKLNRQDEAEDNWETLDTTKVGRGAQALRWLVWLSIDLASIDHLRRECPRVVVNPRAQISVPREALAANTLDDPAVKGIELENLVVVQTREPSASASVEPVPFVPVAERFRLAFVSRAERLAPKRAKNSRQNQRRAERAWMTADPDARARSLARDV